MILKAKPFKMWLVTVFGYQVVRPVEQTQACSRRLNKGKDILVLLQKKQTGHWMSTLVQALRLIQNSPKYGLVVRFGICRAAPFARMQGESRQP